ncbi:NAD-P-binding protein [Collybia nuda]|uniref:NAD-P-binding protein n=1 Tax=Collybia nuda TaxID=64659 RepID=A0A9P6C9X1_9AGAR|nr:NAD-P-binding protein [Collybia nuda]
MLDLPLFIQKPPSTANVISSVYDAVRSFVIFLAMMLSFRYDRFRARDFDPSLHMSDLKGKVAVVTGGNAGIGFSTVKHLVRRGAKVYVASRNESKAAAAIFELQQEPNIGQLEFLHVDLLDAKDVKKAAEILLSKEGRLDILVNNASLLIQEPPQFHQGILDYMLVNHISPFIFTETLLPLMKHTAKEHNSDVRIINVSSDAHHKASPSIRFRNIEDINTIYSQYPVPFYQRYCATKFAGVLFTEELQRRLDAERVPIIVMALHPGNVNTFANSMPYPRIAWWIMRLLFMDPDVGAFTTAFAAASPVVKEDERYRGGYLQPIAKLGKALDLENGEDLAKELWNTTESVILNLDI